MACDYDWEVIDDVYEYLSDKVYDDEFIEQIADLYDKNSEDQHDLKCYIADYVQENIYSGEICNGSYTNFREDAISNLRDNLDAIKDAIRYCEESGSYGDLSLEDVIENPEKVDIFIRQSKVFPKVIGFLENSEEIKDYFKQYRALSIFSHNNEEIDFLKEFIGRIKEYKNEKGVER